MAEDSVQQSQNPNEQLAQIIVDTLVEKGLLTKKRSSEVLKKIQTGKASSSDWRLWAEDFAREEVTNDDGKDATGKPDA